MAFVEHIPGETFHGRRGATKNAFRYTVDYVLLDAEVKPRVPWLFGRNRAGIASLHDVDHGGVPKEGVGAPWVREVLEAHGLPSPARIELLAQPRFWGHVFNPVSFWLCYDAEGEMRVVIAEVTNTFGDRHSYLCHTDDLQPLTKGVEVKATKVMHVSPFMPIEGGYKFRFDIQTDRIWLVIDYRQGNGGLVATLSGPRRRLSSWGIVRSALRRPLGSRRVLALIHWQALILWWKGVRYRPQPEAPSEEVSR
ncbi:MAG: DUF1365 domain-containing protein [Pseudomonadota bacterium]